MALALAALHLQGHVRGPSSPSIIDALHLELCSHRAAAMTPRPERPPPCAFCCLSHREVSREDQDWTGKQSNPGVLPLGQTIPKEAFIAPSFQE